MKITQQTGDRLVLSGIPGEAVWMAVFALVGGAITAAAVWAGIHEIRQGAYGNLFWIGVGLLVGQALFWAGAITLAVARERLELDRATGRGRYDVRSPILDIGNKPFGFDLDAVDSVSYEMAVQESSIADANTMSRRTATEVYRARLRLRRPRRAVVLVERSDANRGEVRALGERVAEFLGVDLADATAEPGTEPGERRGSPAEMARPLAATGLDADTEFPRQPEPNEWGIQIDPDALRITITRLRRGGPPALGCFLIIGTFIALIAVAMAVGVWLPGQTFNNRPIAIYQQMLISIPGAAIGIIVPWLWVSLFTGRRRVIIDADSVRSEWVYPGRRFVRLLPGFSRYLARGESVPTAGVESVTTIKGANGRVVEVRAGRGRIRVGSMADGEDGERESVVWLAKVIRAGVRAFGG